MTRVLVVDDDAALGRALAINLRARGFEVDLAADGRAALDQVARFHPDVVVLDLGLPDLDGIEVLQGIRGWNPVPVVVLSARANSDEKVDALDAGADDYVTKPFEMNELLARVRAAVRRGVTAGADLAPQIVSTETFDDRPRGGRRHARRRRPCASRRPSTTSSRCSRATSAGSSRSSTPLREVWGPGYERETHYLRVYVAQLRRKLEPDPTRPRHLVTEPGLGYRLDP